MDRYGIPTLPWPPGKHNDTSFPSEKILMCSAVGWDLGNHLQLSVTKLMPACSRSNRFGYCWQFTKSGQMILVKKINIFAKMHKIWFCLDLLRDPTGEAKSASADLLAGFNRALLLKRGKLKGGERRIEKRGKGKKGKGRRKKSYHADTFSHFEPRLYNCCIQ